MYRHRDVLDAVDFPEIEDADNVLVGDLTREQQFLLEPSFDLARCHWILRDLRPDHFHGNRYAQLRVPRLIDRTHATNTQELDDVVARTKLLTFFEWAALGRGKPDMPHATS